MQFLRRLAVRLAATLLVVILLSFGLAWSLHQVFGSAKNIKHALAASGIYHSVVAETLDHQQTTKPQATGSDNVPTNRPEIRKIISDAFPPAFLQTQSEQVIDAVYVWLDGKTPSLQFSIDLSGAKVRLADGLGQYASTRMASLPACTAATMPTTTDIDAFNAVCLPPGTDTAAVAAKARDTILNGDFLKDTVIRADTIKTDDGKPLDQQLQEAPQAYQDAGKAVTAGAILIVLLAAVVVFLSATWRTGLHKLGILGIWVGGISVGLGLMGSFALHSAGSKLTDVSNSDKALQQQLLSITQSLADNLRNRWVLYGLTLIVLGIGALLALRLTSPDTPKSSKTPETTDKPAEDEPDHAAPPIPPKPPKRPTGHTQ